jgi:tRNA threonylcarbamoyladenosine biosynthesis protein TsaE
MLIETHSPEETQEFAAQLAKKLNGGDLLALEGDLGAGKTTFIQGLAKAFKIENSVTSPTFIGLQVYPVKDHPSIKQFCHVDAYRFTSGDDAYSVGLEDYINQSDTLVAIEWPENLFGMQANFTYRLKFKHSDETSRQIEIEEL